MYDDTAGHHHFKLGLESYRGKRFHEALDHFESAKEAGCTKARVYIDLIKPPEHISESLKRQVLSNGQADVETVACLEEEELSFFAPQFLTDEEALELDLNQQRRLERKLARVHMVPQPVAVQRTSKEWASIFQRYPTTEDGYVQSFAPHEPEKYLPMLKKYGLVVVKVLSEEKCDKSVHDMFDFFNARPSHRRKAALDPKDSATWETVNWPTPKSKFLINILAVSQTAFDNRTHENIYAVFKNIYGRKDLWCSLDKWGVMRGTKDITCGDGTLEDKDQWRWHLKPHWDVNPWVYVHQTTEDHRLNTYQGILALGDCPEEVGGFANCPCSTQFLPRWTQEHKAKSRKYKFTPVPKDDPMCDYMQRIPLRKGEMVIWDWGQVHGNFPNFSDKLRLMQFIRMMPAEKFYRDKDRFCAPRVLNSKNYALQLDGIMDKVRLSPLGRKLLGLDQW